MTRPTPASDMADLARAVRALHALDQQQHQPASVEVGGVCDKEPVSVPPAPGRPGAPPAMARLCALEDDRFRRYCLLRLVQAVARSGHRQRSRYLQRPQLRQQVTDRAVER
ncbi:hypothetical protein [Streptomyces sparsus]